MPDQRVLSDRFKAAVKTALAMVLAYGVALSMDWDHAYWAAFSVAFCSLSTIGESLNKGLLRLSGTLLAGLAALTLIALFPQDRWLFLIGMSIFTGLCTYMMFGTSRWYFWYVAGFSVPLLALAGGANPLFSDGCDPRRGNSARYRELQPGLALDLADEYPSGL